eukprot:366402-Chlamydomonas_euryale.AAC.4
MWALAEPGGQTCARLSLATHHAEQSPTLYLLLPAPPRLALLLHPNNGSAAGVRAEDMVATSTRAVHHEPDATSMHANALRLPAFLSRVFC